MLIVTAQPALPWAPGVTPAWALSKNAGSSFVAAAGGSLQPHRDDVRILAGDQRHCASTKRTTHLAPRLEPPLELPWEAAVYQFLEGLASEELQAHAGVRGAVATACAQMS